MAFHYNLSVSFVFTFLMPAMLQMEVLLGWTCNADNVNDDVPLHQGLTLYASAHQMWDGQRTHNV